MTEQKVALVGGVSSGIGRAIAESFARHGFRTFGTMRRLTSEVPTGVEVVSLDVRDDASVSACILQVAATAGRIDVLVNNAGVTLYGALEETSVDEARRIFDTNFFGVLRTTRSVLPVMRRQGSGRIINIASVAGFLPMPYQGIYAATKHAVEAYTETLDHEVRRFGIRAVVIEPGYIRTEIDRNSTTAEQTLSVYEDERQRAVGVLSSNIANGDDPAVVANAVLRAATVSKPGLRYVAGRGAGRLRMLRTFLPESMFEDGIRRHFHLTSA
jgi:NAD(P)-dependent dehydrogenase (short-subunit alcohol dehydrogenase family)